MAGSHYDSRGRYHLTESDAQIANQTYADENREIQRVLLLATTITAQETARQREEQERQNARQQSHNEEMQRLESARLEALRQQLQHQKDLAYLEGELPATRAEYLVKRALENVEMPFDEGAFECHLNEAFGEMAKPRLIALIAEEARARTVHKSARQEQCRIGEEVVGLKQKVEQTKFKYGSAWAFLLWLFAAFVFFCVVVLLLSLTDDDLTARRFKAFLAATGLAVSVGGVIWELRKLVTVERAERQAHQEAQMELAKALEKKQSAQVAETSCNAELEKAEHQVSEELGRIKERLIEHFHSESYEKFIRAQHSIQRFTEFVWLRVRGFQEDLPPRCRVTRDSITVDLCQAHYPVLLEQAVARSISRVETARLDHEGRAAKHEDSFAVTVDE